MVGLNFASEDEAEKFRTAVESKITYARRASRPQKPSLSPTLLPLFHLPTLLPPSLSLSAMKRKPPPENKKPVAATPPVSNNRDPYSLGGDSAEKGKPNKPKGKKLTKADIGVPTEFR